MFEIKILKAFEHIEKKKEMTEFMRSFSRKNKENKKDSWILKFEKSEELFNAVLAISGKICEFKMTDALFDFCVSQGMDNVASRKFIDSFFLYYGDFLSYAMSITAMNLDFYLKDNDVLNVEAFLTFNMGGLQKEMDSKLSDPEVVSSLYGLMESSIMDKISIIQTLAETQEILEENNVKIEKAKDFKIYKDKTGIKCINEKKEEITREYFDEKYEVYFEEEDFSDLEVIVILSGVFQPNRVILFNSLDEEEKNSIRELIGTFAPIAGDIKIFNAEENMPR